MPLFYLHVRNTFGYARDEEGQECADLADARRKALAGARSILSEEVKKGNLDLHGAIEIANETGTILLEIPFSEAVMIANDESPVRP